MEVARGAGVVGWVITFRFGPVYRICLQREVKRVVKKKKNRGRANMAHTRQSRPDSGLGSQVKGRRSFKAVPASLASGTGVSSQFENYYVTEMCSGSEASSYLRLIDCVYHSTLGLRVIKKKKKKSTGGSPASPP